jgi:hypothetical protein
VINARFVSNRQFVARSSASPPATVRVLLVVDAVALTGVFRIGDEDSSNDVVLLIFPM